MSEEYVAEQPFYPFPRFSIRKKDEALRELSAPCARFNFTLSLEERIRLFVSRTVENTDFLRNATNVVAPGTPLNWQALLRYLHAEKVIRAPQFTFTHCRNDLPKTYNVGLEAYSEQSTTDGRDVSGNGYASSLNVEAAMSKAVGETLERFFLTTYKRESFLRTSYAHIQKAKAHALDPLHLNGFLPWQVKGKSRLEWNHDNPFHWVVGETIEGTSAYIPAQLVYWNYDFSADSEEPILSQPTTNGAGGHFTKNEAILSGLLENIQRDGFLIYWLNGISPRSIDVSTIADEGIADLLAKAARYGITLHFLNTTSDIGIPSVTCVILDERTEEPVIAIGGGTGFDFRETILHAASEALSVLNYVERQKPFVLHEPYEPFRSGSIGRLERLAVWRGKKMRERFSFFLSGKSQAPEEFLGGATVSDDPENRLRFVLEKLRGRGNGYEVYVYEVKNKILQTLGYHVVQTIVPQLMPLYLSEDTPTLNAPRLREVPAKLGYRAAETLTPWPHPFP